MKNYNKYKCMLGLFGFLTLLLLSLFGNPVRRFEFPRTSQGVDLTIYTYAQRLPGIQNVTANFLSSPLGSGVDSVTILSSGATSTDQLVFLQALMESGTATSHVIDLDTIWTALFASNGWIIELDPYLDANEMDDYIIGSVDACMYKGKQYAYPYFNNLGILYYRKDLLDLHLPGWTEADFDTWEELNTTANYILNNQSGLLTDADSDLVGYVGQFDAYEGGVVNFFEWCGSNGELDLLSSFGDVNINTTEVTEAMTFLKALIAPQYTGVQGTPYIIPRSGLVYDEGASVAVWLANKSIFMRQWNFAYGSSEDFDIEFGIAPLPHFAGATGYRTSIIGGSNLAIPVTTTGTAREAAINFTKFLGDPLAQERELTADASPNPGIQALSNFPALKSVYDNPPTGFEWIKNWTDQLDLTLSRPVHENYLSISSIIADIFNDMLSCQKDVDTALAEMQSDITDLLIPEIYVEIVDREYTAENFKITLYLSNVTGDPINDATIQMWWNGTDVSSSIQNHGNGNYSVNLIPITVLPGEDPILLNMTISAIGYKDKYFETFIEVNPESPGNENPEIPSYEVVLFCCVILSSIIIIYYKVKPRIKK
ncbi:MAG: extracellular solute-binding protein [Promethearchaeota archaeon]